MKPDTTERPARRLGRRLTWFAAIWAAGVATLALVAVVIRTVLKL